MNSNQLNKTNDNSHSMGITEVYECTSKIKLSGWEERPVTATVFWLVDTVSRQFAFAYKELIPHWDLLSDFKKECRMIMTWSYFTKKEVPILRTYLKKHGYANITARPVAISNIALLPDPDYDFIRPSMEEEVENLFTIIGFAFSQSTVDEIRKAEEEPGRPLANGVHRRREESPQPDDKVHSVLRHMMRVADGLKTLSHRGRN